MGQLARIPMGALHSYLATFFLMSQLLTLNANYFDDYWIAQVFLSLFCSHILLAYDFEIGDLYSIV
jgi:hypothetical protein